MGEIIWVILAIAFYFFPALNSYMGHKKKADAVLVLNLLLGWTVIGWIVALVWSVADDKKEENKENKPKQ
jgi:hypothetical protein